MSEPWVGSRAYDGLQLRIVTARAGQTRRRGHTVSEQTMNQPGDVVAQVPSARDPLQAGNGSPGPSRERGSPAFRPTTTSVEAGFFTWDILSGEVIGDPVTYQMHGIPPDSSATIDTFLSRVPDPDLPDLRRAMEQMIATNGTHQIEYRIRNASNSLRVMEL